MIYADRDIEEACIMKEIGISPWKNSQLNPASYDLTLAPLYRKPIYDLGNLVIDCADVKPYHTMLCNPSDEDEKGPYIPVRPGEFILCSTVEKITLNNRTVGRVEGKSSLGRLGLVVHVTAGFIDPGFDGNITLEVTNLAPWFIYLRPGQRIAQIAFERTQSPVRRPYGEKGHYQNQDGPTESRFKIS